MAEAPNIKSVRADRNRTVIITWKGGAESAVDLSGFLADYAVFAPVCRDEDRFDQVAVGEWGWCLRWSEDMEISSDTLWRLAREQGAAWLRDWRTTAQLTETEAAHALGVPPRLWRAYEAGAQLLPKTVKLAALGYNAVIRAA